MSGTSRMHQFERAFRALVQIMGFNADLAALPEAEAMTQTMTGLEDAQFRKNAQPHPQQWARRFARTH